MRLSMNRFQSILEVRKQGTFDLYPVFLCNGRKRMKNFFLLKGNRRKALKILDFSAKNINKP